MKLFFAPLQGYTDAAYRKFHNEVFEGCIECYYTPFLRIERGAVREKEIRDILPINNKGIKIVPQIIVKDTSEFRMLVDLIISLGYNEIDINMGCPFPMQIKRGRGAALLKKTQIVSEIIDEVKDYSNVKFSVKMRLGEDDHNQWRDIVAILNDAPLHHVIMHSRIAKQQYKGEIDVNMFSQFCDQINHNVVYNGDVTTVNHLLSVINQFPNLYGVMIGRGLLASPSLAWEYTNNKILSQTERIEFFLKLHNKLFEYYKSNLYGESHLLNKMKTIWDFSELLIGHTTYKKIKKATNIAKYSQIVSSLI